MKSKNETTETELKTKVLNLIQRQLDHTTKQAEMLKYVNHELYVYTELWGASECSDKDFQASISQLNASLRTLGRIYKNTSIQRIGGQINRLAYGSTLIRLGEPAVESQSKTPSSSH